jgi:predicted kinase
MAVIYLLEGPVGAGKSTLAARLSFEHKAPHLNLDEWMVTLFRPDRPETDFLRWYQDRKARCIEQIWASATALLDLDISVVLELGLVQRADREAFYQRVDIEDRALRIYLLDAPKDVRWARVQKRNEEQAGTYRMAVNEQIFEMANGAWEAPSSQEIQERQIETLP